MTCDNKTCLKFVQFGLCVVVLVYKVWTIWEEQRVGLQLQKKSLEWTWSSYTAAGDPVSLLSDITFGSYVLVSAAFLLGRILGDPTTRAESILLVVGFLLYFITGGILINCVDDVPSKLVVNTLVLGVLSILTGVLFLFDAGIKGRANKEHKQHSKLAKLEKEKMKKEMIVVLPSTSDQGQSNVEPPKNTLPSEYAEAVKPSSSGEEKSKDSGTHSVQIRVKEPERERSRAVRGLDVVQGAGYRRSDDEYPKSQPHPTGRADDEYPKHPPHQPRRTDDEYPKSQTHQPRRTDDEYPKSQTHQPRRADDEYPKYQPHQPRRADDYLRQTPKLVLPELEVEPVAYLSRERNGPKYFPSLKTSPVRHTSSYYVSNPHSPFAWKRLEEHS